MKCQRLVDSQSYAGEAASAIQQHVVRALRLQAQRGLADLSGAVRGEHTNVSVVVSG
jgi:hypothetical protein